MPKTSAKRFAKRVLAPLSDHAVLSDIRHFDVPLTIGVLSDTHIYPGGRRQLPDDVLALFRRFGCGLIVHAGDCNTAATLRQLAAIAPVLAVLGNNDDAEIRELAPRELSFTVGNIRIATLHGDGGASARSEARRLFGGKVDLVIYGHSHVPKIERIDGTLFFNPGSPADRRWSEHFGLGLIHITDSGVRPELILFKNPRELSSIKPG